MEDPKERPARPYDEIRWLGWVLVIVIPAILIAVLWWLASLTF